MQETASIARPYAQAVFELAQAQKDYQHWADTLEVAGAVVKDPSMLTLINSPRVGAEDLADVITSVCGAIGGKSLDLQAANFVKLLVKNRRLASLPQVVKQYELMRSEAEGVVEARLKTAMPANEQQRKRITDILQSRLGREVKLVCEVDESLVGGVVIQVGDWVVDGSVRAQLAKLARSLA